jgi:hypothetical protein
MQNFQKAGCRCICLLQTLQILWMLCGTDLAAKTSCHINNWWLKGNTSPTIAARGSFHGRAYDHRNKAVSGDMTIKARACSRIKLSFGYFWSLTISGRDWKERWIGDAYEHESYTDYNALLCLDGETTTEGDVNSIHLIFVANSKCGGGMWAPRVSSLLLIHI